MAPRWRPLADGKPRLMGLHRGRIGAAYHRHFEQLAHEHGQPDPGSTFGLKIGLAAAAWVELEEAARALAEARRACRESRRPLARHLRAERKLVKALERVEEAASKRPRKTFAQALAERTAKPPKAPQDRSGASSSTLAAEGPRNAGDVPRDTTSVQP